MIASLPLATALSVLFVLTGAYALLRWSAAMTGTLPASRRMAELAHLVMSVAMLMMTWTWAGTAGVVGQIALFTVFTGYFVLDAVRRCRTGSRGCAGGGAHALMAAAMVWMLAAMPLIMPTPVSAGAGGGHGAHAGHGGGGGAAMDMTAHTGPAAWAVVLTVGACAALLAVSTFWAARALRGPSATAAAAPWAATARDTVAGAVAPELAEPGAAGPPAAGPGTLLAAAAEPVVVAGPAPRVPGLHRLLGPRSDAGCHAVMGLGMIAMLLAMVAGW